MSPQTGKHRLSFPAHMLRLVMAHSLLKLVTTTATIALIGMATTKILTKFTHVATFVGVSKLTTSSIDRFTHTSVAMASSKDAYKNAETIYEFTVKDIDNNEVKLDKYKGKVLLVVNVASKCGFTKSNYKDLNELYSMYHDQGLEILGFPCNQFGHQEPGCDVDIKEFMKKNEVKWDMFAKVDVNGDNAIPLFNWLKSKVKGTLFDMIKWNFTKFLIDKDGVPKARYAPNTRPMEFKDAIEAELKK